MKNLRTPTLDIAYEEHGPPAATPIILLHGFPYDPRAYDDVAPPLAEAGHRVIIPYLRGYGPTKYLSPDTMRSGQQAALAQDLLDLMDALSIPKAALAGYDWGGRAACITAALWPERVICLVTGNGYNIQNISAAATPEAPEKEFRLWYQHYFCTRRGAAGLAANRYEFCQLLWRLWSPSWSFTPELYQASAASFENPDFVETVIHSYRHRFGYIPGDPALEHIEAELAAQPPITIPTINLDGADDGIRKPLPNDPHARKFTGPYERRILPYTGHNIPQEAPGPTIAALLALLN
jgi:pimeloyl-ACP methyl ester carboxylesterase